MNRSLFEHLSFTKERPPTWPCPSCEHGRLNLVKETLVKSEDARTRRWKADEEFDFRDGNWHFTAQWRCNHKPCSELVHLVGEASWEQGADEFDDDGNRYPGDEFVYFPQFATPAFSLFIIPEKTPETVVKALRAGFKLVFADSNAAANQLRTSVECLLDKLKVPKRIKIRPRKSVANCPKCGTPQTPGKLPSSKAKYGDLGLHQRIESLPERYRALREELLAMKWLGNAGSHASGISRSNMLTGYEIMERCLLKLYDRKHTALDLQIKAINRKRGKMDQKHRRIPRGIRQPKT